MVVFMVISFDEEVNVVGAKVVLLVVFLLVSLFLLVVTKAVVTLLDLFSFILDEVFRVIGLVFKWIIGIIFSQAVNDKIINKISAKIVIFLSFIRISFFIEIV